MNPISNPYLVYSHTPLKIIKRKLISKKKDERGESVSG
jgi:hypothetical protein